MKNILKAVAVTVLTLAPTVVQQFTGQGTHFWIGLGVFGLAVFGGYWKFVFKPDERFLAVRTPTLDDFFEKSFAEFEVGDGSRFPFRVYIYQPRFFWPFTRLYVVYSWSSNPSDPDHGKTWWYRRGLVGKVYRFGVVAFYKKGHDLAEYNMKDSDIRQTQGVEAIFCYPLRKPLKTEQEKVSNKVTAVVAIDGITATAAEQIEAWYNSYAAGGLNDFVDKAAWLSLYF